MSSSPSNPGYLSIIIDEYHMYYLQKLWWEERKKGIREKNMKSRHVIVTIGYRHHQQTALCNNIRTGSKSAPGVTLKP
jgi:hypothetical protein